MSKMWPHLPARPLINLEPNYEEIFFEITDKDVRNAYSDGTGSDDGNLLTVTSPTESDMLLILEDVAPVKKIKIQGKKNIIKSKNQLFPAVLIYSPPQPPLC